MAHFVLVHGAWHGGWCWARLTPLLAARGHGVSAPDLPGMGADRTPLATITLDVWVNAVLALLRAQPEPPVLVGHSRGGTVISAVAERAPEAIGRLVFVSAALQPQGTVPLYGLLRATFGPGEHPPPADGVLAVPPRELLAQRIYNRCSAEDLEWACARLGPEPVAPLSAPLRLSETRFGRVPRAFVECRDDRAIPLDIQRAMQARLPCAEVRTLAADHSPFLSAPGALAEALDSLASR